MIRYVRSFASSYALMEISRTWRNYAAAFYNFQRAEELFELFNDSVG